MNHGSSRGNPVNRKLIVIAVAAPLLVGLALILYTWPAARAEPHNVPVGLVAGAQADAAAGRLTSTPGAFDVVRYDSVDQARRAIRERKVVAVAVTTPTPQVLIASAAGPSLAMQIEPTLTAVAGSGATVRDIVPTPTTDPKGTVIAQAVLPLTLAGQLCGIMLALAVRPGLRQLAPLVVISAATGLLGTLVVDAWLDVTGPGTWWIVAGVLSVTVLAISSIVLGLHALFGRLGLPLAFAVLVFLGNAFSGSSSAPELLPPAAHRVGQWLPPGAGNELLRSVCFFHGHGFVHPVVVLGIWVALGFAAVLLGGVLTRRKTATGRHEADGANAAVQPASG